MMKGDKVEKEGKIEGKKTGEIYMKQGCKLNSIWVLSTVDAVEDASFQGPSYTLTIMHLLGQ